MKILITSRDALICPDTGSFYHGIIDALTYFLDQSEDHYVYVLSIHDISALDLPPRFKKYRIKPKLRGSPLLIDMIRNDAKMEIGDFLILGAQDHDLYWAANSKILLLSAIYAGEYFLERKIFKNDYGIPIKDSDSLIQFFAVFQSITTPWYYNLNIDRTSIYALTNANTMYASKDAVELNFKFKECLKDGNKTYRIPFLMYFLLSTYHIFKDLNKVDYWGIFPSSNGDLNEDLQFFCTKARQTFGGKVAEPLLIRHTASTTRHSLKPNKRIEDGCDEQFETIIINPYFAKKLKGKTVCIIDDFTTYGTSAETARALFQHAGVAKLIFIALGKYGSSYYRYEYILSGDLFSEYIYERVSQEKVIGHFNTSATKDVLDSIKALL